MLLVTSNAVENEKSTLNHLPQSSKLMPDFLTGCASIVTAITIESKNHFIKLNIFVFRH